MIGTDVVKWRHKTLARKHLGEGQSNTHSFALVWAQTRMRNLFIPTGNRIVRFVAPASSDFLSARSSKTICFEPFDLHQERGAAVVRVAEVTAVSTALGSCSYGPRRSI